MQQENVSTRFLFKDAIFVPENSGFYSICLEQSARKHFDNLARKEEKKSIRKGVFLSAAEQPNWRKKWRKFDADTFLIIQFGLFDLKIFF